MIRPSSTSASLSVRSTTRLQFSQIGGGCCKASPFEVVGGGAQFRHGRILAEDVSVTGEAQEPANTAGAVVVIDVEFAPALLGWAAADRADAALGREQRRVIDRSGTSVMAVSHRA